LKLKIDGKELDLEKKDLTLEEEIVEFKRNHMLMMIQALENHPYSFMLNYV
jgi:hypothetical protein